MKIARLVLNRFKCVSNAELQLGPINVVVGGNNAGKSSVLQGIHFCVCAAAAGRRLRQQTFSQEVLPYVPAKDFSLLRHGLPYSNQTHFGFLQVWAQAEGEEVAYKIEIYRGRNEGNVRCVRSGDAKLGSVLADYEHPFSVYVPGLAGVPTLEQLRSEGVIRNGVASGDSNLYLRNVLYLITQYQLLPTLVARIREIFPNFVITIEFEPKNDLYLRVAVSTSGEPRPLEQAGTGLLQALQIFSYVTLFKPQLLLLDEPDSHLHPDNQVTLARTLIAIGNETDTQVVLSTHSRHLVDYLDGSAHFVWLRQGGVFQQGGTIDKLSLLMDLGALSVYDKLQGGNIDALVLTEDADVKPLESLLEANGFPMPRTLIFPYKSSSRLDGALVAAEFVQQVAQNTRVIIHRDRDFMTDEEVQKVTQRIEAVGALPFITEGADVESYFVRPGHVSQCSHSTIEDVETWLRATAEQNHNELVHKFTRKRDEVKFSIYRANPNDAPDTLALMGNGVPLEPSRWLGKLMLAKVRGLPQIAPHAAALMQPIATLSCNRLVALRNQIFQ